MKLRDLTESTGLIQANKYKRLARQAKENGDEQAYRKYTDLASRAVGSYASANRGMKVREDDLDEGTGLIRGVAAALGLSAAMWAAMPSAVDTPLGKAMQAAAQQGDPVAAKHLKNLDFYSEENPVILKKLSDKYLNDQQRPTDR